MRVAEMSWMEVEDYLRRDDRAVLPLGSTEQHAYLSLATDSILAERVAAEAAEPLGIPVFPVLSYGITPYFTAYPGTLTLGLETHLRVVRDLLDSLAGAGFRRVLVVNGHGGNAPAQNVCAEWMAAHPGCRARFHNWWSAPRTMAKVRSIDPVASHASWMESFPLTRPALSPPEEAKAPVDFARLSRLPPAETRQGLGDGNFGGRYQRPDGEMAAIWAEAVAETRELLASGWD